MKKLILILILMFLFASVSTAVETMVITSGGKKQFDSGESRLRSLTVDCVADTDGSFSLQLTDSMFDHMKGWLLMEVRASNLSTETDPTADSDIYFRLEDGGSYDILNGSGVDMLDPDIINSFIPFDSLGAGSYGYMVDQFWIEVSNNSVNGAEFSLTFILYPTK